MLEVSKISKELINESPLVVGFFEEQSAVFIDENIDSEIIELFNQKQVEKSLGSITKVHTFSKIKNKIIYLVCLGKTTEFSYEKLEKSLRKVNYKLGKELTVKLDSFAHNLDVKEVAKRLVQTIGYYNYVYDELLTKKTDNKLTLNILSDDDVQEQINEGFNIAVAINNTRDLVNKPHSHLNAVDLANYAIELVEDLDNDNLSIKVYNKKEIELLEMGAFLSVNKGSTIEPRLIHIKYEAGNNEPIGIIGKGVMFDTGGYSIKDNMLTMKCDMAGAATALGVLEAVVKNNLKVNIHVIICATDNRINGEAYLPDDVLTAMNKMTIEIKSTDAEGRLTLADAVTFAQKEGCVELIDIATLTGAVVVALGDYVTGLFGNNEANINKLLDASKVANEEVWHMPINEDIREQVRGSKVADLTNSTGRLMGASSGAAFIEAFVEKDTKWMHLDIAGTAFTTSPRKGEAYGATGATLKTLYTYLENENMKK